MRWTKEQFLAYEQKRKACDTRKNPVMELTAGNEPLEENSGQEKTAGRIHIRFTSVRKRLCDPDNLCEKYLLDCLRYCGFIEGDEPEKITLELNQRKALKGEREHTVIELLI